MQSVDLIKISIITLVLWLPSLPAAGVEDITQQTLSDPLALAELQQAGTVFFTDGFEDGDFDDW